MQPIHTFTISEDKQMVLAAMREHLPHRPSWSAVKKLQRTRRVSIGGVLCVDEGRRLAKGEVITIWDHPLPPPPTDRDVSMRFIDSQLVVVEKPAGMVTLRRKSDSDWSWARKNLQPTLDECVSRMIAKHAAKKNDSKYKRRGFPRLLSVHRIDRDSSGLIVFARNQESQTKIIRQFAQHDAVRKYLALIPGSIADQTVASQFIRDRGDGLRGSTTDTTMGERAVTHFKTLRKIGAYSELECRLETGRTNQIRIHLAELGHPICGDIKYRGPFEQPQVADDSHVRRMALHAADLRFEHPISGDLIQFQTEWPEDIQRYLAQLA
ncbi:MAG: RluA family pseudouridine synthase [Planctomycetaceae bacterium]|nr:RluA family pseudouridine synthase [Planctomycetaceae bacterium]